MKTRKLSARPGFHRRSKMKVAIPLVVLVVAGVLFVICQTGWFHLHGARSGTALTAQGAESSAPFRSREASSDSSSNTAFDRPAETLKTDTLTGEAAREELRKSGQYESLGAAFQAARYAAEKIDPSGPHSRGAEYFASNSKQQLRAWCRNDGIELASGRRTKDGNAEPWRVEVRPHPHFRGFATRSLTLEVLFTKNTT